MTRTEILASLDEEIFRLQQVKRLLQGSRDLAPRLEVMVEPQPARRTRRMTDEGRRRIAEAQKRRWAKAKAL